MLPWLQDITKNMDDPLEVDKRNNLLVNIDPGHPPSTA